MILPTEEMQEDPANQYPPSGYINYPAIAGHQISVGPISFTDNNQKVRQVPVRSHSRLVIAFEYINFNTQFTKFSSGGGK